MTDGLKEIFKTDPGEIQILEDLVKYAMLDNSSRTRNAAVLAMKKRYGGLVRRGFVADMQLYIDIAINQTDVSMVYVCDVKELDKTTPFMVW
jgi:hypothetical protein